MRMKTLLFVCSGNLHRSVMAAALTHALFRQLGRQVNIGSAGTLRLNGRPAPSEVHEVLGELGLDVSAHRSRPLSRTLIELADAVIVMEDRHGDAVLSMVPAAEDRLFYLGDYLEEPRDVPDPIGQSAAQFRVSRDEILGALKRLMPELSTRLGPAG